MNIELNKMNILHRHIGGLEMVGVIDVDAPFLHRHIGGLETDAPVLDFGNHSSPPHRRRRNIC